MIMSLASALLILVQTTFVAGGIIICENLDTSVCAFSVSSSSTRCVLEKTMLKGGQMQFSCCSSEIEAGKNLMNWLETDTCIHNCGLHRNTVGISSDSLLDRKFTPKLCSSKCYDNCPNIIDLYFNLAMGEGVFLPKLCEEQTLKMMVDIRSSGAAKVAADHSSSAAAAVTEVSSSGAAASAQVSNSDVSYKAEA